MPPKRNTRVSLVVALDFGTSGSGYAMSFPYSPNDIKTNKNWGENLGFEVSLKVITS